MKKTTARTSRTFLYSIHSDFIRAPTSDFSFQKKKIIILKLDAKIHVPAFNTMWKKPYSVYTCELWNFPIYFCRPKIKLSSLRPARISGLRKIL